MRNFYLEISHPGFGGKRMPLLSNDFSPGWTVYASRAHVIPKSGVRKDDFRVPSTGGAVNKASTSVQVLREGGDDVSSKFTALASSLETLGKVVITDYAVVNGKEVLFMTITMEGVIVERIQWSEDVKAGKLIEAVEFRARLLRFAIV